jgi:hypothetical protein
MSSSLPDIFGADPVQPKWQIVRGDTATMRIEFLQDDEKTYYDTTGWTYRSSTYDLKGSVLNSLQVSHGDGYVEITALPSITSTWGTGYKQISSELLFDIEVTTSDNRVWTPVIGNIVVLSDVSGVNIP